MHVSAHCQSRCTSIAHICSVTTYTSATHLGLQYDCDERRLNLATIRTVMRAPDGGKTVVRKPLVLFDDVENHIDIHQPTVSIISMNR